MKTIFAHDHIFVIGKNNTIYSSGQFPSKIWERYLSHFDAVTIVARKKNSSDNIDMEKLNVSNHDNVCFKLFYPDRKQQIMSYPKVIASLEKLIKPCEGVIARLPSAFGILACKTAIKYKKPYAVEVVGCAWDAYWNYGVLAAKIYAPFVTLQMKQVVKNSSHALYVTKEFLQKRYPSGGNTYSVSDVEIIGMNELILNKSLERRKKNRNKIYFGFSGSLGHRYKGLHIALKALRIVRDSIPNFELKVLGGGDSKNWARMVKSLDLENHVIFEGVLPSGEPVMHWLDNIDVFLQPSFQEGLPRTVIEAMSRGCPVLGSFAGGIPELINVDCLHPQGDYKKLSRQIERVASDLGWEMKLAKENFKVAKNFQSKLLNKKRDSFLSDYAEYINKPG